MNPKSKYSKKQREQII